VKKLFENWRRYLKEDMAAGALRGTLAGISGLGRMPMPASKPPQVSNLEPGEDLDMSVKAILHRNGMVLLLKNEKGWDLPGGHVKESENTGAALVREIFEETGLNVSDVVDLHLKDGNKQFFSAEFLTDDVALSDEHSAYDFFNIDQIRELDDLSENFKEVIIKCFEKLNI